MLIQSRSEHPAMYAVTSVGFMAQTLNIELRFKKYGASLIKQLLLVKHVCQLHCNDDKH